MLKEKINQTKLIIEGGNIVKDNVTHCIVNWTIPSMNKGDDIFMEIHQEGGTKILDECQYLMSQRDQQVVPTTEGIFTTGGFLPVKKILHMVAPGYWYSDQSESQPTLLKQTMNNIFRCVEEYNSQGGFIARVTLTPCSEKIYGEHPNEIRKITIERLIENAKKTDVRIIKLLCRSDQQTEEYTEEFYQQYYPFYKRWFAKLMDK